MEEQLKLTQDILSKFAISGSPPVVIETEDASLGSAKIASSSRGGVNLGLGGGVGTKFNPDIVPSNPNATDYEKAQDSISVKVKKIIFDSPPPPLSRYCK